MIKATFEKFFGTPIAVTDGGRRRRLLPEEILMKKLVNEAAKGNVQAMRLFFSIRQQHGLNSSLPKYAEIDYSEAARKFVELASKSEDAALQ